MVVAGGVRKEYGRIKRKLLKYVLSLFERFKNI